MSLGRLYDLTMPLWSGMPAYPGEPTASYEPFSTVAGDGVAMSTVHLFSQLGTHMDAPAHFIEGGATVDEIDLARCIGPATVLDMSHIGPHGIIDTNDLHRHSESIKRSDRVLISTGWSRRLGSSSYFSEWPVLTQGAADYLASSDLKLLGLDTPSPGNDDSNVGLHRALLGAGIALVECLIGVHELPPLVELTCLPLPLVGLDGSPVRALARG